MSDLEDRLSRLRPARAPESLWERVQTGRPAPAAPRSPVREPLMVAAAASLAAALLYVLFMSGPDPAHVAATTSLGAPSRSLALDLLHYPHRIVFESRRDGNGEIYRMDADGTNLVNLTNSPDIDECYPKASPDGSRICYVADENPAGRRRRSLWVMNADGKDRRKIADHGREPCWSADGTRIAFVKNEFDADLQVDFATRGLYIADLATGAVREHSNGELRHLYTLNWTNDGKWFIATVHGAMGFTHNVIAVEADGPRIVDLGLDGCRPDVSPDGTRIAWGRTDFTLAVGDLEIGPAGPSVSNVRSVVESLEPIETYHVDWSPDGRYISFSYGPKSRDKSLKGLLPEFPGVEARGWNIGVADASGKNVWTPLTTDGRSNKEPDWLPERRK
jgi:Tol biopolymer transport system component